jgi:hypothetical protein
MFSKADIEKYFIAEKTGALVFAVAGVVAIGLAILFIFYLKTNYYKGASVPLILVGLLFGIAGFTVFKRSDADRLRNVYAFGMDPGELKNKELPRMEKVMRNFVALKYAESALFLVGLILFIYFRSDETQQFWKGFGLSLAVMALLAWGADHFAERRGSLYLKGLKQWSEKA